MKIMERRYVCKNGVVEKTHYAVGDNTRPRGKRKKGNTSFRKQEANYNTAVRRLARILNCNYSHENGLLITLDYDRDGLQKIMGKLEPEMQQALEEQAKPKIGTWRSTKKKARKQPDGKEGKPEEASEELSAFEKARERLWEAADHQLTLWLRKIKRACSIKTVSITSDIDGDSGECVRVHHHVVLTGDGVSWDLLQAVWKLGSVDIKQLRDQPDYTPVALYLMEQVRRRPDAKKYRVSRGMEQPATEEREISGHSEIKAPAGAMVVERSQFETDVIGQYIRYIPRKRSGKELGKSMERNGKKPERRRKQNEI